MHRWLNLIPYKDVVVKQWYVASELLRKSETLIKYVMIVHDNSEKVAVCCVLGFLVLFSIVPVIFVLRLQKELNRKHKREDIAVEIVPPVVSPVPLSTDRMAISRELRPPALLVMGPFGEEPGDDPPYLSYDPVSADSTPPSMSGSPSAMGVLCAEALAMHEARRVSPCPRLQPDGKNTPEVRLQPVYRKLDPRQVLATRGLKG
jgi:hypothetical protein